ncbi:MAG: chorismate synthase [Bacteroidetes bacterium]|nr:MAG: chorismate synthase [Bacteroidota bacterium]
MPGSSIGTLFRLTTFGESHGAAIGGIIDGFPSNFPVDLEAIQAELDRRRPGQSSVSSPRKESDQVRFLSGLYESKSTGAPIAFIIENTNQRSQDYDHLKSVFRPSHSDFSYQQKYGIRDHRGGGRSSARETACRVVAGAMAQQFLEAQGIQIRAFVDQVGPLKISRPQDLQKLDRKQIDAHPVRCPEPELAKKMEALILDLQQAGDSVGGSIFCRAEGVPAGLGEPVFDKLHAELARAMLSINATKGFELGSGFQAAQMTGSEHNDAFLEGGQTATNNSGGIQGGISNGMPIYFRVAFKPVATILREQQALNSELKAQQLKAEGRHDPCVVPRAVPIVEAMTAITLLDFYLMQRAYQ